jgi:hypothetical protein
MAECPIVPKGVYEEAMEEMSKALSTIHCISVKDKPIPALEMQARHKQRILNAQKESGINDKSISIGNNSSHSLFVKATGLKTSSTGNKSNKTTKTNKKKVQYLLEEEQEEEKTMKEKEDQKRIHVIAKVQNDATRPESTHHQKFLPERQEPQREPTDDEDDLFASLTSFNIDDIKSNFTVATKTRTPTKGSTPHPTKISLAKPSIPPPPPVTVSLAAPSEKPAKRQKRSNK